MKLQDLSFPFFLFQTSYIVPICLVWYVQGVCKFLATTDVEQGVKTGLSHWFRTTENIVLRKTIGPVREEVTDGWRKLHC